MNKKDSSNLYIVFLKKKICIRFEFDMFKIFKFLNIDKKINLKKISP